MIFNRALSATEIKNLFKSTKPAARG